MGKDPRVWEENPNEGRREKKRRRWSSEGCGMPCDWGICFCFLSKSIRLGASFSGRVLRFGGNFEKARLTTSLGISVTSLGSEFEPTDGEW